MAHDGQKLTGCKRLRVTQMGDVSKESFGHVNRDLKPRQMINYRSFLQNSENLCRTSPKWVMPRGLNHDLIPIIAEFLECLE
jgi:hypothetical protein